MSATSQLGPNNGLPGQRAIHPIATLYQLIGEHGWIKIRKESHEPTVMVSVSFNPYRNSPVYWAEGDARAFGAVCQDLINQVQELLKTRSAKDL
jgi:hypothetical protein